jgi:hypothetical protein
MQSFLKVTLNLKNHANMWFIPFVFSLIEFFITILGHEAHRFNLKIIFKQ